MTSIIKVDEIQNKAGTGPVTLLQQHAAKAWHLLDGSGTISTLSSFNVSSARDTGTGNYVTSLSVAEVSFTRTNSRHITSFALN